MEAEEICNRRMITIQFRVIEIFIFVLNYVNYLKT